MRAFDFACLALGEEAIHSCSRAIAFSRAASSRASCVKRFAF
jgi:hypothetical protein